MAITHAALPPMCRISLIRVWIETMLYGFNCVMYGLCMFIPVEGRLLLCWMLIVMSTILFLLCTIHVGTSLRQLLDAFVYAPADVPNYPTTYWLDYTTILYALKSLYTTLVLGQGIILVSSAWLRRCGTRTCYFESWRLYVVFMCNWRAIIFPIILAAGCVGCAYAASAVFALPNNGLYGSVSTSLIISAWVFGFTLNVSVTEATVTRLWWMVVESGAISAANNVVVLALFASNSPATLSGMDVAAQLVALTPLLIVVQVGQTEQYLISSGNCSKTLSTAQNEMSFQ
ncbi:hypothetical protein OG21DRAFT_1501516 [Imleria badia]|nr:hypothetical protein OG21DRAFT_1501516 [Imleria badia]